MSAPGHSEFCACAECVSPPPPWEREPADVGSFDPATMEAEARVVAPVVELDPWLERRGHGFGASEIAALLIALGLREPVGVPKYMVENARKILAVKAGTRRPSKVGRAAREGSRSERALIAAWDADGECPVRSVLGTIAHADAAPRSFWPLVDRHCPRLTCTPDGWARDLFGEDVIVEAKCTTAPLAEPHWYWTVQVQAQLAVTSCAWGALVIGDEWAADWKQPGRVHAHAVERDEAVIAEIRGAVVEGWRLVEARRVPLEAKAC